MNSDRIADNASRREFLADSCALGIASLLALPGSVNAEAPLETTKIRLVHAPGICLVPQYIAEEFLRMEGFTEVEYVKDYTTYPGGAISENRADFSQDAAWTFLTSVEAGGSPVALAGVHAGCYELFASDRIKRISDLKGKSLAVPSRLTPDHLLMASILAYVGIDPNKDVTWMFGPKGTDAVDLYLDGKADAYLAFAPQGYDLRAKKAGHVLLNTGTDRPWSQYFCCIVVARREYLAEYPIASKRALRAFLKATDICYKDPQRAARMLVDRGFEPRYEIALQVLKDLPYQRWREVNAEDTLRFYALRFHEIGMIKSDPSKLIKRAADWRLVNELKKELKT